ncbi:protein of unknown function DUF551 [Vibrio phage 1.205.O._10N.222.51.A7]|nr:protein of unknown function DUF551 [Vibrio phage 1.205.O._10N.222.51.A7]
MSNLKPCPFCNGEARISTEWDTDGFGNFHSVKCGKCGAESKQHFASSGNDCPQHYAEVREDWNQRASGWISVEDKLPEKEGKYLCAFSDGTIETYDFEKLDDGRYGITDVGMGFEATNKWHVTHWMPLPNNPE